MRGKVFSGSNPRIVESSSTAGTAPSPAAPRSPSLNFGDSVSRHLGPGIIVFDRVEVRVNGSSFQVRLLSRPVKVERPIRPTGGGHQATWSGRPRPLWAGRSARVAPQPYDEDIKHDDYLSRRGGRPPVPRRPAAVSVTYVGSTDESFGARRPRRVAVGARVGQSAQDLEGITTVRP